jgi:hypothetical protein
VRCNGSAPFEDSSRHEDQPEEEERFGQVTGSGASEEDVVDDGSEYDRTGDDGDGRSKAEPDRDREERSRPFGKSEETPIDRLGRPGGIRRRSRRLSERRS